MASGLRPQYPPPRRRVPRSLVIDRGFHRLTLAFVITVPLIILLLLIILTKNALPTFHVFGWKFLTRSIWDPVFKQYGVLFAIYGTAVSSLLALLIAVPISLGTAIFLAELAPRWLREPVSFLVELLAAIPSIVYGLWGIFILIPMLRPFEFWLGMHFPAVPLFHGPPYGIPCMFAAGLILAIMILPYITAVSRDVILAVPQLQREASFALGATRWETISGPVLYYARSGILGAVILGLGRALGETMAVAMVIGSRWEISASLFSPAYTMPSLLANEFTEASDPLQYSSLIAVALVLVLITIVINAIARTLIWSIAGPAHQEVGE